MGQIAETIRDELLRWPGVTAHSHRFGGTEFRVGHGEIGHLHGDRLADLPFPRRFVTNWSRRSAPGPTTCFPIPDGLASISGVPMTFLQSSNSSD